MSLSNLKIDKSWSLFLDRDGVINRRIVDGYVTSWDKFEFLPGVIEALTILSASFSKVFVVSNQQGIGKGIMTEEALQRIHTQMMNEIGQGGGRIDKIYYSPFLKSENSVLRKPNVGMALKARREFPGIRFSQSVMVGDSISDMAFGKKLGMITVFISTDKELISKNHLLIDNVYTDLPAFANSLASSAS